MNTEINQLEVNSRIKMILEDQGLSQTALQGKSGISNVSRKMDTNNPVYVWTPNDINKISAALNISKKWLLYGEGEMYQESKPDTSNDIQDIIQENGDFNSNIKEEIIRLTILMTNNDNIISERIRDNENIKKRLNTLCTILKGE